jgi:hypothetical protein
MKDLPREADNRTSNFANQICRNKTGKESQRFQSARVKLNPSSFCAGACGDAGSISPVAYSIKNPIG